MQHNIHNRSVYPMVHVFEATRGRLNVISKVPIQNGEIVNGHRVQSVSSEKISGEAAKKFGKIKDAMFYFISLKS